MTQHGKCKNVEGKWVKFTNKFGSFSDIVEFFDAHKISFLTDMPIDFDLVPENLLGKGKSTTLRTYLGNNIDNNALTYNFINYFVLELADLRYYNINAPLTLLISNGDYWYERRITIKSREEYIYIYADSTTATCDDVTITCDMA